MSVQVEAPEPEIDSQHGVFNFLSSETQGSLFRDGGVMIRRDPDGNTAASHGIDMEAHGMPVVDARLLADHERPTCNRNGFALSAEPGLPGVDFTDHADVVRRYYPHCAELVQAATGARAYAFDHNVRSASGKEQGQRIAGGQHVQGPAHVVHGDYTLRSGPERLHQLTGPPSGNDTLVGMLPEGASLIPAADADPERFAIINLWRSIVPEPVVTHPMALCDAQTVMPDDLVVFEIHYPDRIGENYFAKYSPAQRIYYFPEMTADEALLIKQWDSAGTLARSEGRDSDATDPSAPCTFSFHSAFVDPATPPDAPDRWSIEVRCMVIYD